MSQEKKGWEEHQTEWLDKKEKLETGCLLLGQERIISIRDHESGEIYHDQFRLDMQVV